MAGYIRTFTTDDVPARYRGLLPRVTVAYEVYGELNAARDNAILVIHGFSSSSHVASHGAGDAPGWWEWAVGKGRSLDTDKYFIVCANNFGSCFGSSGPAEPDADGRPLGARFSPPAVADIVAAQRALQQALGITRWHAVIGGSLGGMAALQWAADYPDQVGRAVCLNAGARLSFIGQGLLGLQTEMIGAAGERGLHMSRRLATLSFLGEEYFRIRQMAEPGWSLEGFLAEEADGFAGRFNLYSYVGFIDAMRTFDLHLPAEGGGSGAKPLVYLVGCEEDVLFPPSVVEETRDRLRRLMPVDWRVVRSSFGHDAFLLDESLYAPMIAAIIEGT